MVTTTHPSVHAEASLHRKLVLFAVQLEGYLAHFPNCHKYTLTQSIRQAFVDVYNLVTECQKRYHKKSSLTQLDIRHEQLPGLCARMSSSRCALMPAKGGLNPLSRAWVTPREPVPCNPF